MTAVAAAWCENLTEAGRLLPEKWRVGGPERRFVITSIVCMIREDVIRYADELTTIDEDPMAARLQCGDFWRELVDDAICSAMTAVLT